MLIPKIKTKYAILMMTGLFLFFSAVYVNAASMLNFSGKITDTGGSELADGVYDMNFKIYDTATGGTVLWSEDLNAANRFGGVISNVAGRVYAYNTEHATSTLRVGQYLYNSNTSEAVLIVDYNFASKTITVASGSPVWAIGQNINNRPFVEGGIINENLGSVNDISVDFSETRYLELEFNGEIMEPRKIMDTAANAFNAERLGGQVATDFVNVNNDAVITGQWSYLNTMSVSTTSAVTALTVNQSGSGDIVRFMRGATTSFAVLSNGQVQFENYSFPISDGNIGYVLKTDGAGSLSWQVDITSNVGSAWATSSNSMVIYPADTAQIVVVGSNATSSSGYRFEVRNGDALFEGARINNNLFIGGSITSGLWNGSAITNAYIASSSVWNVASALVTASSSSWTSAYNQITASSSDWYGGYQYRLISASGPLVLSNNQLSINSNNNIPLNASTTNWQSAYLWGNHNTAGYLTNINSLSIGDLADVVATSTLSVNNLMRWNGTSWVGYADSNYASSSHNHTGIYQAVSNSLTSISNLATLADQMLYTTGANTYATTSLTAFSRGLLSRNSASLWRTDLGLGSMALEQNTGSTSITILGTIASGRWQGNVVAALYGGTGTSTVQAGYLLMGNGSGGYDLVASSTLGSTPTLSSLTDVNITGVQNGQLIRWDSVSSRWINMSTSSLGINLGDTTGTLNVNRGGTGRVTWTPGGLLFASSTTELGQIATGTVISNGWALVWDNVSGKPTWASTTGATAHNMLSASHGDSEIVSINPGDLMMVASSGKWSKLATSTGLLGVNKITGLPEWQATSSLGLIGDNNFVANGLMRRIGTGTYDILTDNSANWNSAFSQLSASSSQWSSGYQYRLISATGPLVLSNNQISIDSNYNIPLNASTSQWVTAYGWGNHSLAGYLVNSNNLSDLTSTSTARTNLGLQIGTNVQAYDAELSELGALTKVADRMIYLDGSGNYNLTAFTTIARNLMDDTDASAMQSTLGLGTMALISNTGSTTITTLGSITNGTWQAGTIAVAYGGTGTSTAPSDGYLLMGNGSGGYQYIASSSLGSAGTLANLTDVNITTKTIGDILYYDGSQWKDISTSSLGIAIADTTGILSTSRGGTNWDSSGQSGIAILNSGSWGTSSTLPTTMGGTGKITWTQGGLLFATTTSELSQIEGGTNGYALTWSDTLGRPVWASTTASAVHDLFSHGDSDLSATITRGSLITRNATNDKWTTLTVGNQNQFLTINGTGDPIWASTTNINQLGTITTGVWNGTAITNSYIASSSVWNGITDIINASSTYWNAGYNYRLISAGGPLNLTANALTIDKASSTANGYLSSSDWVSFNNKISLSNISETLDAIDYNNGTGVFSLNGSYLIPLISSTTNWQNTTNIVNASSSSWTTAYTTIVSSSTNWDIGYNGRLQWDGGATNLVANTGRASLGLGTMALENNIGSTTITTLGTIATGVWQGAAIGNTYIASSSFWNTAYSWGNHATQNYFATSTGPLPVAWGGTGQSVWNAGGLLYASTTGILSQIATGTNGYALVWGASGPTWSSTTAAVAHDLFSAQHNDMLGTPSAGDLIYRNASNQWTNRSIGTIGQVLWVNGSNLPAWTATSSLGFAPAGHDHNSVYLQLSNNLSDLSSTSIARTNLGLATVYTNQSYMINSAGNMDQVWMGGGTGWRATSTLGLLTLNAIDNGTAGYIPYYSSTGRQLTATSSIYLNASRNVGIGTSTNMTKKLSVYGGAEFDELCIGASCITGWSSVSGVTGAGVNGEIAYWTGASTLTSEAQLSVSRGGTGRANWSPNGLIFASSTGTSLTQVATGSDGQVLKIVNGIPQWSATSTGGAHAIFSTDHTGVNTSVTPADGDIIVHKAGQFDILSRGNNNQYLVLSAGLPVWATTTNITELGTIITGIWNGTAITNGYIASSSVWNNTANIISASSTNWQNTTNLVNASSTNWNTAYTQVNASSTYWNAGYNFRLISATGPLNLNANALTIAKASSTADGYLSMTDWSTFNSKISLSNISENITGLDYNNGTGVFSMTTGYSIASTASSSAWQNTTNTVNASSSNWQTAYTTIISSSTNWDIGYNGRLQWDGGATNLVAATGRTSLGLGTMAIESNIGSTTITTLGTISTGVWQGTAIGNAYIASSSVWNTAAATVTASSSLWQTAYTSRIISTSSNLTFIGNTLGVNAGYVIPLNASTTNWQSAYNTVIASGTNWQNTTNLVTASSSFWNTAYTWGNHALGGYVASSSFSSNGIMVRTAAGTYTTRVATGTLNKIVVSNGDGVSGNLTFNLASSTYLGTAGQIGRDSTDLIDFSTDNQISFRTNNVNRMTLNVDGYLGIGTSSPTGMLTVGVASGTQFIVNSNGQVIAGEWLGKTIDIAHGGTGTSTPPTAGKLLIGNSSGEFEYISTSSLGITQDSKAFFVGTTTVTTNGNFSTSTLTGYKAANEICAAKFAGSYLCRTYDIMLTIEQGNISDWIGGSAWISQGPPGFTANSNDCNGWKSSDATALGSFWSFDNESGGEGWLTNCSVTKPLACCAWQ